METLLHRLGRHASGYAAPEPGVIVGAGSRQVAVGEEGDIPHTSCTSSMELLKSCAWLKLRAARMHNLKCPAMQYTGK